MPEKKKFFTFEDLKSGFFEDGTKKFAVLGCPIGHSLSPLMQNAALERIAESDPEFEGAGYFAFEIFPENLREALDILLEKGFLGANLTIPHKVAPLSFLEDVDSYAKSAGACNTLLNDGGKWKAFNTDGFGLEKALQILFEFSAEGRDIFILGAGGAARGAAFWLGRKNPRSLNLSNRSKDRLQSLVSDLRSSGIDCGEFSVSGLKIPENSALINATSIGLGASDGAVADFGKLPKSCVFFDMPYRLGGTTKSVEEARRAGLRAESGLAMLAYQGAKSLEIWTSKQFMGDFMFEILRKI